MKQETSQTKTQHTPVLAVRSDWSGSKRRHEITCDCSRTDCEIKTIPESLVWAAPDLLKAVKLGAKLLSLYSGSLPVKEAVRLSELLERVAAKAEGK